MQIKNITEEIKNIDVDDEIKKFLITQKDVRICYSLLVGALCRVFTIKIFDININLLKKMVAKIGRLKIFAVINKKIYIYIILKEIQLILPKV
jgi:hypothetical protein